MLVRKCNILPFQNPVFYWFLKKYTQQVDLRTILEELNMNTEKEIRELLSIL